MGTGDYASMGRLGDRTELQPHLRGELARTAAPATRGLFGRRRGNAAQPQRLPVRIVDYSVTGVGLTTDPAVSLSVGEECVVHLGSSASRIRIVESHPVGDEVAWGAMLLDPRPELIRAIEEVGLHRDVAAEEARWNDGGRD
ncbi:MAG: hypothetical protein KDA98_02355 [Acidimicrobiales bacterium]|nr:hypothetical protein [Acidimicrobiales bacterium]